jgi:hypothetical protein
VSVVSMGGIVCSQCVHDKFLKPIIGDDIVTTWK